MKLGNKLFKKAQGLPLNTIVIAILVIIVMLVIIVFFTSKVGESGQAIDNQQIGQCSMQNPAIQALGATNVKPNTPTCTSPDKKVPGLIDCCYTPRTTTTTTP